MKILKVIHGYPPLYNAGSEVYSQTLCHELVRQGHEVMVFTREEVTSLPDIHIRDDSDELVPQIKVRRVNMANHKDRYIHEPLEKVFLTAIKEFSPDVIHFGHLNHLSIRLPNIASQMGIACIFTIHDFWMMCPRGQFIQMENNGCGETWNLCDGQESSKCADKCYRRYFSGDSQNELRDMNHWTNWTLSRMKSAVEASHCFDAMIAPSKQILSRFSKDFPSSQGKLTYLDYGFDLDRLKGRKRIKEAEYVFGYIGTHTPAKGISLLIEAFLKLPQGPKLRIWGNCNDQETAALKRQIVISGSDAEKRVEWLGGYRNQDLVAKIFDQVDCIVVPSIWLENSPLVIHEAQQARIPVITANAGGMGEFVHNNINGLTFTHRNPASLAEAMNEAQKNPKKLILLGQRGYINTTSGDVPDIQSHTGSVVQIYQQAISRRSALRIEKLPAPRRITFDTNPDDCNLSCIMCEDHSPFSQTQTQRIAEGRKKRRMNISIIQKVIQEQAPLGLKEIIPSTMGEPLLYKDFNEIINLCYQYNVKLNLTTNGTFPKLGAEAWAKKLVPICSDVKISWNGGCKATQEKIMQGSDWDMAINNIKTFVAVRDEIYRTGGNRCKLTLQLTFMQTNLSELPEIISLAASLGIDRVKGHHLWAHFSEIKSLSLKHSAKSVEQWNIIAKRCRYIANTINNTRSMPLLLENFEDLDVVASSGQEQDRAGPCPFLGKEAWVNAEGRFDPCCCPDILRQSLGNFGNVSNGLKSIWEGEAYSQLLDNYLNRKVCRTCNMRRLS